MGNPGVIPGYGFWRVFAGHNTCKGNDKGLAILVTIYKNTKWVTRPVQVDDYLLCRNRIPAYEQLILLFIYHIQPKSLSDVGIINQAKKTPRSNAHKSKSQLDIEAAADIGKHKLSTRENMFYINSSSLKDYKYNIVKKINLIMLTQNWKIIKGHMW